MAGRTPRLRARRHGLIGRNLPRPWAERIMEAAISASGDEEEARRRDVRSTPDVLAHGAGQHLRRGIRSRG